MKRKVYLEGNTPNDFKGVQHLSDFSLIETQKKDFFRSESILFGGVKTSFVKYRFRRKHPLDSR